MSGAATKATPAPNSGIATGQVIELPLHRPGEYIDISCDELPVTPADDLTPILYEERVPLQYYLRLALEYNKRDMREEAITMLERGLNTPYETTRQAPALLLAKANADTGGSTGVASNSAQNETQNKEALLTRVVELLNRASEVDPQDTTTLAVRGQWLLARRQLEEADRQFQQVLTRSPQHLAALYGKARLLYGKRQYGQALEIYQRILRLQPQASRRPDPRVGIGLCFEQLGMHVQARMAFERVIELNPTHADALVLLAILDLNEVKRSVNKTSIETTPLTASEQRQRLERAQSSLLRALKANKHHAPAACGLADQFFFNRQMPNVIKCAMVACKTADANGLKAEAYYQLARAHHYQKQWTEAANYYKRSLQSTPQYTLSQLGSAQMLIHAGDYDGAIDLLEKLKKEQPDSIDILMMLASLYASSGKSLESALQCFDKVVAKMSDGSDTLTIDAELFAEMGSALLIKDPTRALRAYRTANRLYSSREDGVPIVVANNLAALEYQTGDKEVAHTSLQQTYERCKTMLLSTDQETSSSTQDTNQANLITIKYNLARLKEELGQLSEAQELYQSLLKQCPAYTDARLRLSIMEENPTTSMEQLVVELKRRPPPAMASLLMAERYLSVPRVDPRKARKHFETVLQAHDRYDIWALCGTGWQHILQSRREATRTERDKALKKGYEFFTIALRQNSKCTLAVNGLGVVLAESGMVSEARDLFGQVREASSTIPSAWINLAHAYAALGQSMEAVNMYETCARRFSSMTCDPQLWLCAANQLYRAARLANDPLMMKRAIRYVQKTYAYMVGDLESEKRTVDMLLEAAAGLGHAKSLFQRLAAYPGEDDQLPYSRKIADQRQKYGDSLLRRIQERQQHQSEWEAERDRILSNALAVREQTRLAKEAAVEEEKRAREAEERRIEELNRQIQQQALIDMKMLDEAEAEAEAAERSHSSGGEDDGNASSSTKGKRRRTTNTTGNKKRQRKTNTSEADHRVKHDDDYDYDEVNRDNDVDIAGPSLEDLEEQLARQEVIHCIFYTISLIVK
ncbi:hypothetical protein BDF19DRAFT_445554 [Syncephalis fuscata]|nr:hypothetical protein BDF19DRAFT_445554 [Syncephalis fuscata]